MHGRSVADRGDQGSSVDESRGHRSGDRDRLPRPVHEGPLQGEGRLDVGIEQGASGEGEAEGRRGFLGSRGGFLKALRARRSALAELRRGDTRLLQRCRVGAWGAQTGGARAPEIEFSFRSRCNASVHRKDSRFFRQASW